MAESTMPSLEMQVEMMKKALREMNVNHTKNKIMLLEALVEEFGDEVKVVVEKAGQKAAFSEYKNLPLEAGDRTVEKLISVLWEPFKRQGMQYTVEQRDKGFQMNCTKCPIADLFQALGKPEWGFLLFCTLDEHIARGFNEKIGMTRTKTLMEGHECCDHFYFHE